MAKSYGFIDPAMVLARIRSFSQASEVQEPLELVKAGVIFQDRGLINWIFGSFRKTEIRCQRSAADSFFSRVITISAVSMVGT